MAELALVFDLIGKDRASKEFRQVGDAAEDTGKKTSRFGPSVAAAAAVAGAAVLAFGKSSVNAYVEAEQSSLRLDEALRKFPATNDVTRASFDQLNTALAQKTRFDDDATASGQAVLAQFGLTGAEIQKLTPLLQDYAAKTGKDLPTAAEELGKAVLGQGRALKSVGIEFADAGSKAGNLDQITAGLRTQVGGFAQAEGKTAAGAAAILGNRFGEVQETIGGKLTPALTALATGLLSVINFLERNKAVVIPLAAAIGALAAVVVTVTTVAKVYTAVQTALNLVLSLNPIGLVVIGLVALAAGLVIAYNKSETFRTIVQAAFIAAKVAFEQLKVAFAAGLAFIVEVFDGGGGKIGSIIRAVVETVRAQLAALVNIAKGAINVVVGIFTGDFGRIKDGVGQALGGVVKLVTAVPNLILSALGNLGGLLLDAGGDIMEGLARGIKNAAGAPIRAAKDAARAVADAAKGLLGINSPSKVFMGIGANVSEGFAQGIQGSAGQAQRALTDLTSGSFTTSVGGDLSGMGGGLGDKLDRIERTLAGMPRDYQLGQRQMAGA